MSHLHDRDDGHEDGRWAEAVLVEVPASVSLAGQDLVGHIAHEALVDAQARLVQQDLALQRAPAVSDGPSKAAGTFTAHLGRGRGGESIDRGQEKRPQGRRITEHGILRV